MAASRQPCEQKHKLIISPGAKGSTVVRSAWGARKPKAAVYPAGFLGCPRPEGRTARGGSPLRPPGTPSADARCLYRSLPWAPVRGGGLWWQRTRRARGSSEGVRVPRRRSAVRNACFQPMPPASGAASRVYDGKTGRQYKRPARWSGGQDSERGRAAVRRRPGPAVPSARGPHRRDRPDRGPVDGPRPSRRTRRQGGSRQGWLCSACRSRRRTRTCATGADL